MSQTDWKLVQRQLRWLGYYKGLVDGIRGRATDKAVAAFQGIANLTVDGDAGPVTCRELNKKCPNFDTSVATAATLIKHAYKVKKKRVEQINKALRDEGLRVQIIEQCPEPGVEAYLLNNGYLLVPGSNSLWDYLKFNLRRLNFGMPRLGLKKPEDTYETVAAESGITWHQGFFTHANHVRKWIEGRGDERPIRIIGHSLGAASAQILSTVWNAPSIGFAAPRLIKSKDGSNSFDSLALSVCREDDPVCRYPAAFTWLGDRVVIKPKKRKLFRLNHKIERYQEAMEDPAHGFTAPAYWDP